MGGNCVDTDAANMDETLILRQRLEKTQTAFVSILMEKNFLQRAVADLNFHHNTHDGIVYTDVQNRVVYANPYFLQMLGIESLKEVLNKPLPRFIWSNPDDEESLFKDVRENGFVRERELSLYNRIHEPVVVACSAILSKDDDGNVVGTEIMLYNITGKRKAQAELMESSRQLEQIARFCDERLGQLLHAVEMGMTSDQLADQLRDMQAELKKVRSPKK